MSTSFNVKPEELLASSYRIMQITEAWVKEINSIYVSVDELHVSYKGETSEQFIKQLAGYLNDFDAALKALQEYVEFLKAYAIDIQKTEDDLTGIAAQLPSRTGGFNKNNFHAAEKIIADYAQPKLWNIHEYPKM